MRVYQPARPAANSQPHWEAGGLLPTVSRVVLCRIDGTTGTGVARGIRTHLLRRMRWMDVARSYHVRALHEMGAHCRIGDEHPYEVTGVDDAAEPLPTAC
jgi:hypothetical protein